MDNENRKEDKRGIFLGIVGILTLIVAIIGASFAYFSLNARSNENAVKVQAATVQIVYEEGQNIAIDNIIPSTQDIALETVRRAGEIRTGTDEKYVACMDDNNYRVCGTYDFTLTNNGTNPVDINAYITPTALKDAVVDSEHPENNRPAEKGFKNLKFITFDRTGVTGNDNGTKIAAADGLSVVYNGDFGILAADKAATAKLGAGETKTYRLFIWLDEKGEANDVEQGAVFNGTVHVDVVGADQGITGNASSSR